MDASIYSNIQHSRMGGGKIPKIGIVSNDKVFSSIKDLHAIDNLLQPSSGTSMTSTVLSVKYLNFIIPTVRSCGMAAQEKLSLYHPSTDGTQGNWNEGATTVGYTTREITNREVKRFFLMVPLKRQGLLDSISFSKLMN